jgi:GNAT superfamily N-acetyltransferase
MKIETRELVPELWPDLEKLFAPNGACGGCWCMFWRLEKGEKYDELKGPPARARLRKGVLDGAVKGALAFADGVPVGWCTFGPRRSFPRLDRSPSLRCNDADLVWSIPCFYVKSGYRKSGVAGALLRAALRTMRRDRARVVEAYPARPDQEGRYVPAFAYTGTIPLFERAGFTRVDQKETGKVRMRREIR